MQSDNQQQATKISDLEGQLADLQQQLCELNELLASAGNNQEANNQEVCIQLEIAQRKIANYKQKMLEKAETIRKLEVELATAKTE